MWKRTSILHSGSCAIDLYVSQCGQNVEIAIAFTKRAKPEICPIRDRLRGEVASIVFDQKGTPVAWSAAELSTACEHPRLDQRRNRQEEEEQAQRLGEAGMLGHTDSLDYLKYHLANAINESCENRGFSRFLKKELVGKWSDGRCQLVFQRDGTFEIVGPLVASLMGAPTAGEWTVVGNMLVLMEHSRVRGIRTQVVDLRENTLFLPGGNGCLHNSYVRE